MKEKQVTPYRVEELLAVRALNVILPRAHDLRLLAALKCRIVDRDVLAAVDALDGLLVCPSGRRCFRIRPLASRVRGRVVRGRLLRVRHGGY